MEKITRFVGLDVHAATISLGVCDLDGTERYVGRIANESGALRKALKKLGTPPELSVCYEAGPCGYGVYWELVGLGISCAVVAPSLIPHKPGDRVKTDRRDALKLARNLRGGDLTSVWVPDKETESLRDLVRARYAAKKDERKARHRLSKLLLRHGLRKPAKCKSWGAVHWQWLDGVHLEQPASEVVLMDYRREVEHATQRVLSLETSIDAAVESFSGPLKEVVSGLKAMRGIAQTTAVGIAVEVGNFSRFEKPRQLMSYSGSVPKEHSSGSVRRQGGITKTGNEHLRRLLTEAAWSYRFIPRVTRPIKKRQEGLDREVTDIAWRAQKRLHSRYHHLSARGKPSQKVVTAVGRELLGFVWEIAVHVEKNSVSNKERRSV